MGSQNRPSNAIELLQTDHREVEQLFEQFEKAGEGEKVALAQRICQALTVHAHVEEQLFYPALRGRIESDLLDEADVEHQSLKELIAKIDGARESDELFDAHMKVLGEYVKHHVKEEENEIMPAARSSGIDLQRIGAGILQLKEQLESRIAELAPEAGARVNVLEVDGRGVRHPRRTRDDGASRRH